MSTDQYIPVGRTSLVRRGDDLPPLQVQTEYSRRPYARIATTVTEKGRVLHKIEKKLEAPVSTFEEQMQIERVMQAQHLEVERVIEAQAVAPAVVAAVPSETSVEPVPASPPPIRKSEPIVAPPAGLFQSAEISDDPKQQLLERLRKVRGAQHVFLLDAEGNFYGKHSEKQFKKDFGKIFRNLSELISVFGLLDSPVPKRETGVVEVERDRLYFISTGEDCYFVTVRRLDPDTDFEQAFKALI
ncbi:MAG TPA: hypothetical protein PLF13_11015 [candidate division Zixibacteria bacterium]|nr:hypothetical protein [candidate division Zixibacteria bacterium]